MMPISDQLDGSGKLQLTKSAPGTANVDLESVGHDGGGDHLALLTNVVYKTLIDGWFKVDSIVKLLLCLYLGPLLLLVLGAGGIFGLVHDPFLNLLGVLFCSLRHIYLCPFMLGGWITGKSGVFRKV
jgi:hypothetical protein